MDLLLEALQLLPEYGRLRGLLEEGRVASVSGVSQIHRLHLAAGLYRQTGRPMVLVCQDDQAAVRTAREL